MNNQAAVLGGIIFGTADAIVLLVRGLEDAHALKKGSYAANLRRYLRDLKRDTPKARRLLLQAILRYLENEPPKPSAKKTRLKVIQGGKRR